MNSVPIPDRPALRQAAAPHGRNFPSIHGLHHHAYRCRNAQETRRFYEDLLGLPLACALTEDHVPSTGEFSPFFHIFFEMADGSYLAFFDLLDDRGYTPDPQTASWVNHLALEVASRRELDEARSRLVKAGVEVLGVVDHGWFDSIYFFDPNGIRLELVFRTAPMSVMREKHAEALQILSTRDEKAAQRRAYIKSQQPSAPAHSTTA